MSDWRATDGTEQYYLVLFAVCKSENKHYIIFYYISYCIIYEKVFLILNDLSFCWNYRQIIIIIVIIISPVSEGSGDVMVLRRSRPPPAARRPPPAARRPPPAARRPPPAARRPPLAARNGVNAITQKPRDGLFSNLVYTLVVIVSWPD